MFISSYQITPVKNGDKESLEITINLQSNDKQNDFGILALSATVLADNHRGTSLGKLNELIFASLGNALLSYSESEKQINELSADNANIAAA